MPSRRASTGGRGRRALAQPAAQPSAVPALAPSGAVRSHASRARRRRPTTAVRAAAGFGHLTGRPSPYGSACCFSLLLSVGLRRPHCRCCFLVHYDVGIVHEVEMLRF